jgi:FkbM family methyltransferase
MWLADTTITALRPVPFRGKSQLLGWLLPGQGIRRTHVFGSRVELDLSDLMQRMVYLGTYEREQTAQVRRYLRPGMTVVDVGASFGYYTLLAAQRVGPSGRVFAFEPHAPALARLERAVHDNGLAQVRVCPYGLGRDSGWGLLYAPGAGNDSPSMIGPASAPAARIALSTLDEWMAEMQVEGIDLLKLDAVGYEPEVLAGAARALAERRIAAILCELNDPWLRQAGTDSQTLYDTLLQAGFVDFCAEPPPLAGRVWTRLLLQRPARRPR